MVIHKLVNNILGGVYLVGSVAIELVSIKPKSRVAERYPDAVRSLGKFPSPGGQSIASFVLVSNGVRHEKIRDGFGMVPGEIPMPGVLRARRGDTYEAWVFVRFSGAPELAPDHDWHRVEPHGFRVRVVTSHLSREDAEARATRGRLEVAWRADGTRCVYRFVDEGVWPQSFWSRAEWDASSPRVIDGRIDRDLAAEAALEAAPYPR